MTVTAKFFASLREVLDMDQKVVNLTGVMTVSDVWAASTNGAEMPPNTLIAVNMEYVDKEYAVNDGDEVAFFPPVSGG